MLHVLPLGEEIWMEKFSLELLQNDERRWAKKRHQVFFFYCLVVFDIYPKINKLHNVYTNLLLFNFSKKPTENIY